MTIKRNDSTVFSGVRGIQSLVFCVEFDVCSFSLGIVLSVLLRFAASGNPSDSINLFLFRVFVQILCYNTIPFRYANVLAKRGMEGHNTAQYHSLKSSVPF